jgi:hypothetical protein
MSVSRERRTLIEKTFLAGALLAILSGCGSAEPMSCETEKGRNAIVTHVDSALSDQDCAEALRVIEIYYPQTGCGTDEIRLARASANACAANVNFFELITNLGTNNITGTELWVTLTKLFPSSTVDQRVTGGQNALDALFAIRIPGMLTPPQHVINSTSVSPGSLIAAHRTEDSNLYTMLVSMSLVGALQNRYGAPQANWHRGQKMGQTVGNANGWEDATAVDVYACTYAGALLTMFDSINQVGATIGSSLGGTVGSTLTTAASTFSTALDSACDAGCVTCGMPAGSCTPCPTTLRNRLSCTGLNTDVNSCAAAGIASFMDTSVLGWQN